MLNETEMLIKLSQEYTVINTKSVQSILKDFLQS
jgi:hypothetical protein